VTSRRPAGALLQASGVIFAADENGSALDLLEVAFETEIGIAHGQHLRVDAAMGGVTSGAAFAHRLVFKHVWTALGRMTFKTIFVLREQGGAAAGQYASLVRRMTFRAFHPAFGHGMVAGQLKLAADIIVALVTNGFGRAGGRHAGQRGQAGGFGPAGGETEGRLDVAAGIRVQAAWSVAGFAADIDGIGPGGNQPRMIGGLKAPVNIVMALFAFRGADVFGARHIRKIYHLPIDGAARDGHQKQNNRDGSEQQIPAATTPRRRQSDGRIFFHSGFQLRFTDIIPG